MDCLENARRILQSSNCTCVFYNGDIVLTDYRRGVKPLLELLNGELKFFDFSAADKVVGKAAAFLYCLLKVKNIYAGVLSQPALEVLTRYGIPVSYGTLVPAIENRTKTGFCPMESAVWDIHTPEEALKVIQQTVERLSSDS